jgi:hypothetical protein
MKHLLTWPEFKFKLAQLGRQRRRSGICKTRAQ